MQAMNEKEFKELFHSKYNPFCNYAVVIVKDEAAAEDIVQEVFIDFWKRFGNKEIPLKVENYLIRAIKFKCIDLLRKQNVHRDYVTEAGYTSAAGAQPDQERLNDTTDLQLVITLAVDKLPLKTREVFVLSKIDKLSYRQIAERLN